MNAALIQATSDVETATMLLDTGWVLVKALWIPVLVVVAIKGFVVLVGTIKKLGR